MAAKEIYLTLEGLKKIEEELEYLKVTKRTEIAERIKQALSFGDISENSEYDEAKNEQAHIEVRIVELEKTLKNAKVIDEDEISTDVVSLGAKVKLFDVEFDGLAGMEGYKSSNRAVFIADESGAITYKWVAENPGVLPDFAEIKNNL